MSKIKNPIEKKENSYNRDYYVKGGESDKGLRKSWPRKKAYANRAFRRRANQLISKTSQEELSTEIFKAVPKKSFFKWGILSLGERMYWKAMNKNDEKVYRVNPMLSYHEGYLYSSRQDRQQFKTFLCDLLEDKVGCPLEIAYFFDRILFNHRPSFDKCSLARAKTWFRSFFQDEPLLEPLLCQWVLSTLSKHKSLF